MQLINFGSWGRILFLSIAAFTVVYAGFNALVLWRLFPLDFTTWKAPYQCSKFALRVTFFVILLALWIPFTRTASLALGFLALYYLLWVVELVLFIHLSLLADIEAIEILMFAVDFITSMYCITGVFLSYYNILKRGGTGWEGVPYYRINPRTADESGHRELEDSPDRMAFPPKPAEKVSGEQAPLLSFVAVLP